MLSMSGQPTDDTFYRRKPLLNVKVSTKIGAARLYGLENHLPRLLKRIEFSNGAVASLNEIWTINPMPKGGFSTEELAGVNLSHGEERHGPRGETLRKMIRKTSQQPGSRNLALERTIKAAAYRRILVATA